MSPFSQSAKFLPIFLTLTIVFPAIGHQQGPAWDPDAHSYPWDAAGIDVTDYLIDLSFDFDAEEISGSVGFSALCLSASLDSIRMDLFDNMVVDSVMVEGTVTDFLHSGGLVRIPVQEPYGYGDEITGSIAYHGQPDFSGFGGFTWSSHKGVPLVSTVSWPWYSPGWWPCHEWLNDKALAEIYYTVPDTFTAISNGRLVETTEMRNGTRTFHWSVGYPIVTYLIMAAATNYDEIIDSYISTSGDTVDIIHYVYPEHLSKAQTDFDDVNEMLACFEERFGAYPFPDEKFGFAEVPLGGGMEHQTMVSIGSSLITGNHSYRFTFAHELAHMWWGDMVTIGTWKDFWLSEGFAVFAEALYEEWREGHEAYLDYMKSLDGSFPGTIYDPDELLSDTVYNKGAWVVHMLRGIIGEDLFWEMFETYASNPLFKYGNITTSEFIELCEDVSGLDLDTFFEQWVYSTGRPDYYPVWRYEPSDGAARGGTLTLTVEQLQDEAVFEMPLDVRIEFESGDTLFTVIDTLKVQEFSWILESEPADVTLDPDGWVLKKLLAELSISTSELPSGAIGEPYIVFLDADGGIEPYSWSLDSGSLPPGLELDTLSGMIIGYPEESGVYPCSLGVKDSYDPPHEDRAGFSISIDAVGTGSPAIPERFEASMAFPFPNPMNPVTSIVFSLPGIAGEMSGFKLALYDPSGKLVKILVSGQGEAGEHSVAWDGRNSSGQETGSGVYICRLTIEGGLRFTRKLVVVK